MLWQPIPVKHPEDLTFGQEGGENDICACGHSSKVHSRVALVTPLFIDGEMVSVMEAKLRWFDCHEIDADLRGVCECPGFWRP